MAKIALHTELFPSLISREGTYSGVVDSLVEENFLPPILACHNYETNILNTVLLEENL